MVRVNQQAVGGGVGEGGVVTSPQAPPTKSLNGDWNLLSEKPVWQYIHTQKYVKGRKYIKGIYIKDSVALYKSNETVFKFIFLKPYYYYYYYFILL